MINIFVYIYMQIIKTFRMYVHAHKSIPRSYIYVYIFIRERI